MAIPFRRTLAALLLLLLPLPADAADGSDPVQLGPRPFFLVEDMDDGPLKERLRQCKAGPFSRSAFSIAHRGAPLMFPEHTRESYEAAHRMGAGVQECDVTFTKDRELVCRHSQCDLATTTDILLHDDLAAKCSVPFRAASGGMKAQATCCTSDITLAEFRRLKGKMDASDPDATTPEEFVGGTASWRTDLYASRGTLMTHAESIELFKSFGARMTPELKEPEVSMPFDGDFTQEAYADKLIAEYEAAGVAPADVMPQSFNLDDVRHWIANHPDFGRNAIYLDGRYGRGGLDPEREATWAPSMVELAEAGVTTLAPPLWVLVRPGEDGKPEPSAYARAAKAAGLDLIAWSLERSGPLTGGGGWFYQSIGDITDNDGDVYELLDALANEAGVRGVFSDWPATTTYFANCFGLD
ncbi:MAG: glycerophosphodiester phosphodiesterase [Rhizobiaceae bacterium]|nr:glycerophosphodiester phosphodiesterase [Rhizobiaceae bacterium]MCV0408080.1 glycerophosphodiester phosphodiesterase [Rhizobiaceae bacterium]